MQHIQPFRSVHVGAFFILTLFAQLAGAQTSVSLNGGTTLPTLENAQITVFDGAVSSALTADESGQFSVQLQDFNSDLIRIQACGVGNESHICYTRLVHTAQYVSDNANGDGEFRMGPISPLSTIAYASLVKFGLDGQEPQQWADIQSLVRGHQAGNLASHAATLYHIAQSPGDLPAGFSNLLELALDQQALAAAVNAVDPGVRNSIIDLFLSRQGLFLVPESQFPVDEALLAYSIEGQPSNRAYSIQLDVSQSGLLSTNGGSGTVSWENLASGDMIFADDMDFSGVSNRYVRMLPASSESIFPPTVAYVPVDGIPGSVEINQRTTRVDWRMVDVSESIPVSLLAIETERVAPNHPELGPEDIPSLGITIDHTALLTKLSNAALPSWSGPVAGTSWAFPRCHTADCVTDTSAGGAQLDFIAFGSGGSATARISGESLTWQTSGDRYEIVQGSGVTTEVIPFGAESNDFGDLATTKVVARSTLPDGQVRTTSHYLLEADATLTVDAADVPGRYLSMSPLFAGSYIQLDPDNTGWTASLNQPGDPRPAEGGYDINWEVLGNGDLLLEILLRDSTTVIGSFPIRPVRQTPAGLYAIQRLRFAPTPELNAPGTLYFLEPIPQ